MAAPPPPRVDGARRAPSAAGLLGRLLPSDENTRFFLLAMLVGAGAAAVSSAVKLAMSATARLAAAVTETGGAAAILCVPAAGAALSAILMAAVRRNARSLPARMEILESLPTDRTRVSVRRGLLRSIASTLAIGAGVPLGREGAMIELSGAAASRLGLLARLSETRLRTLVAAGAAAGLACAFRTPVAGTLFAIEIIVGSFAGEILGPTIVAAAVATFTTSLIEGTGLADPLVAELPSLRSGSALSLLPCLAIGPAAAVAGGLFVRAGRGLTARLAHWRLPRPVLQAAGGLVAGTLLLACPALGAAGRDPARPIPAADLALPALLLLATLRLAGTLAAVVTRNPGGILSPSLLAGAALGAAVSGAAGALSPALGSAPAPCAAVGMGAMLAAVTHAPLTCTILLFEMTRDAQLILPGLVACVVAAALARRISPRSIYRSVPRSGADAEAAALRRVTVADILRPSATVASPATPLRDLIDILLRTRADQIHVVDAAHHLAGVVDMQVVKKALAGRHDVGDVVVAADLATLPPVTAHPADSLEAASDRFWSGDFDVLPVVASPVDPTFLGIVTRRDLLGAVDRAILRRNVLVARIRGRTAGSEFSELFELPARHRLESVPVPASLVGLTFGETDLRRRFGLNLLAVRRLSEDGREDRFVPTQDYRAEIGDFWVVLGRPEDIAAFLRQ